MDAHLTTAQGAHKASAISIDDAANKITATNVEGALQELFTLGDSGKKMVRDAIIAKGGTVAGTMPNSFQELASGVGTIKTGYSSGSTIPVDRIAPGNPLLVTQTFKAPAVKGFHAVNHNSFRGFTDLTYFCFSTSVVIWYKSIPAGSNPFSASNTTVDKNGNVYWVKVSTDQLIRWDENGNETVLATVTEFPKAMYFDTAKQRLYIADTEGYLSQYQVTGNTAVKNWRTQFSTVWAKSMVADPNGDFVYIALSTNNSTPSRLFKIYAADGLVAWSIPLSSAGYGEAYVRITSSGAVFVLVPAEGITYRVSPWNGELSICTRELMVFLGSDPSGNMYSISSEYDQSVRKLDEYGYKRFSTDEAFTGGYYEFTDNERISNAVVGTNIYLPIRSTTTDYGIILKTVQEIKLL